MVIYINNICIKRWYYKFGLEQNSSIFKSKLAIEELPDGSVELENYKEDKDQYKSKNIINNKFTIDWTYQYASKIHHVKFLIQNI